MSHENQASVLSGFSTHFRIRRLISGAQDKVCSPDGAMIDLWTNEGAAPPHKAGVYQEWMFVDRARHIMAAYAANASAKAGGPLFLYYASHAVRHARPARRRPSAAVASFRGQAAGGRG